MNFNIPSAWDLKEDELLLSPSTSIDTASAVSVSCRNIWYPSEALCISLANGGMDE